MNTRLNKLFVLPALLLALCLAVLALPSTAKAEDFDLAAWRNNWSGVSLGETITAAQMDEIYSGNLTTIKLGDYWTLDGTVYRVADYDYYYGQNGCTDHDLVLVPDVPLNDWVQMETRDTNANGYYGSAGRTTLQSTIKEALPDDVKNNLLTHNMYMSTATNSNSSYSNTWTLEESNGVELMSVAQVFGNDDNIATATGDSNWKNSGYSSYSTDTQISLFKFASDGTLLDTADYKTKKADNIFKPSKYWWLASTVKSDSFVRVNSTNEVGWKNIPDINATVYAGVRPAITIKGCNHTYGKPSYEWASDNSKVTATRTCIKCSIEDKQTVDTDAMVTQEADCTKPELTTYTATFTNTAFSTQTKENVQTKAALGHDAVHHDAVDATCTEDGNKEYWTCSRCNKYFSDEACTTEISQPESIPATGHTWDAGVVTKEPTATEKGLKTFTCTACGTIKTEEIPATGTKDDSKTDDSKADDKSSSQNKKDDSSTKKSDKKDSSSRSDKSIPQTGDTSNFFVIAAAVLAGLSLVCGGLACKKH